MRPVDEIQTVLDKMSNLPQLHECKGDNFKYGLLIGKVMALDWVMGEQPSGEMGINYDYEGWVREQRIAHEDISDMQEECGDDES